MFSESDRRSGHDRKLSVTRTQVSVKKRGLIGAVFCFSLILLPVMIPDTQAQPSLGPDTLPQSFFVGLWRGFYQTPQFTMYYGYEFRSDATYTARHRVYQGEVSVEDAIWQGTWNWNGQILSLRATRQDLPDQWEQLRFHWGGDRFLYYQDGTLPPPYLPRQMAKQDKNGIRLKSSIPINRPFLR